MGKVDWSDEEYIKKLCNESYSYSEICNKLELIPQSNIRTLKKYILKYDINIDHFEPYKNRKNNPIKKQELMDILIEHSTYHRWHLKNRLILEGILINECSECKISGFWNNKELKLHLDHINGCNTDNRLINLRLLCPNCHSQTDTYGGKNKVNKISPQSKLLK